MIFVSHNLGLILETCDKITVMYSGEAVETGSIRDVFDRMRHPIRKACSARSLAGADKNSRPLSPFPASCRCRSGRRAATSARAATTSSRAVQRGRNPNDPGRGHDGHYSRCVRFNEIDWDALPPGTTRSMSRSSPARRC
jgi:peptide/nickel transport system ATP-binding protein